MLARSLFVAAAAASLVSAQLQILAPGGPNLWWVANSVNNIVWNCQESQFNNFTVLLSNSDPKVLVSAEAIVAIQYNYDCSKTLTTEQANFTVANNYKVLFANPLNSTDVYAESDFFEVKPQGSLYPASSATPTASGTATGSGSASGTGTATTSNNAAKSSSSSSAALAVSPRSAGALGALLAGAFALLAC